MPKVQTRARLAFALVVLTLAPASAVGQRTSPAAQAVDEAVLQEMREQNIVGAAIGIIRNSEIVYTQGYGFANLEAQAPVTDNTVFNWASNSKPVMAVAALQLVERGQLDIDQSITAYLPDLPEHLQPVTTRHLLCHQSGIPHYSNGRIVRSGERVDPLDEIDPLNSLHRFIKSPLIFEPGARTEYSSYAYVLLSAVVQAAGKQPIERQLLTRIGRPLRLSSFQLDMPSGNQRNWTTAYKVTDGTPKEVKDYAHFWKHGAGGYKSNVKDFARFALALMQGELLSGETSAAMWTPQVRSDGSPSGYGLGVAVSGRGKDLKVSHNGSQDETRTRMVVYPPQRHGVVVMCNTQGCDPNRISTAVYSAMRN